MAINEVKYTLEPETHHDDYKFPKTTVVQKNVEDFKDFRGDHMGKVKNLG